MRFSNILLVIDTDEGDALALARAIRLARRGSSALTICKVVDSLPKNYLRMITAITMREILDSVVAAETDRLARFVSAVDTDGVSLNIKVLVGKFHHEIARLVRREGHDLVLKSIAGRRAMGARSVQRKDRALMRTCPCPVWLVNVAEVTDDGGIVAALDMPAPGSEKNGLNEHILRISRSIATTSFRPLHIVHAWNFPGERHLRTRGDAASDIEVNRMIAGEASGRMAWLQNVVRKARSTSDRIDAHFIVPELHVIKGNPVQVVSEVADELGAGLVVMGSAARSGVSGALVGNTAEMVLPHSECSFLIVKEPRSPLLQEFPGHSTMTGDRNAVHRMPRHSNKSALPSASDFR